jgi:hypothetical protein
MAHCRKCGVEIYPNERICRKCLSDWFNIRREAFAYVQHIHGKMCGENLPVLQKEMKRLDRLWKRDPTKFYEEIAPQENIEGVPVQPATAAVCHAETLRSEYFDSGTTHNGKRCKK